MTVEIPPRLGPVPTSIGALGGDVPVKGGVMALPVTFSDFTKYIDTPYEMYIHPIIPVGSTVDLLLDLSNPGTWMLHCHIGEHVESGMMAALTVDAH